LRNGVYTSPDDSTTTASAQTMTILCQLAEAAGAVVRPLAFHATWNPTFTISSLSNVTFHVAHFLRDSLYASNICYNGLHLFSGSYGHADRPDLA